MGRARALTQEYGSLGLLLLAVAIGSASLITSCGSGGDADGSLCSQCGVSPDGPCQEEVFVAPGPDADELCDNPAAGCTVELTCRRKVDSAQQRCFPHEEGESGIDFQFECDGSRPGGTVIPQATVTPTATANPDVDRPDRDRDARRRPRRDGTGRLRQRRGRRRRGVRRRHRRRRPVRRLLRRRGGHAAVQRRGLHVRLQRLRQPRDLCCLLTADRHVFSHPAASTVTRT